MKKITPCFLVVAIAAIISQYDGNAQPVGKVFSSGLASDIVNIEGTSAKIANLFTLDSVKAPHIASFDIDLNSSPDAKKILTSIFSAAQGSQPLKLSFSIMNSQNQVMEERNYNSATVNEILFPDLNGSSKDVARLRVTIQAQEVSTVSNQTSKQLQGPLVRGALASNFKLALGNLPTTRVSGISSLRINRQGAYGYLNFSVEVARVDAKLWKDWFNTGAGGGQRLDGTITLYEPNMTTAILSFQLPGVEIMSVSESNTSQENIPKTVFGLRTKGIEFMK